MVTDDDRPARRAIPIGSKREVAARQGGICECGCDTPIWTGKKCNIEWDHDPALRLRNINADGTDYDPPQHDPDYIVARCEASHDRKTHGTGATTAGTDAGKIKKERRRAKPKKRHKWAARKMQSANRFPKKGSRPMTRRKSR